MVLTRLELAESIVETFAYWPIHDEYISCKFCDEISSKNILGPEYGCQNSNCDAVKLVTSALEIINEEDNG